MCLKWCLSFGQIWNWGANLGSPSATGTPAALESSRNLQQSKLIVKLHPGHLLVPKPSALWPQICFKKPDGNLINVYIWVLNWNTNANQELLCTSIYFVINIICNKQFNNLGPFRLLHQPQSDILTTAAESNSDFSPAEFLSPGPEARGQRRFIDLVLVHHSLSTESSKCPMSTSWTNSGMAWSSL